MTMPFDTSVVCPVLIGRIASLASFERVFEQVKSGQGHTILVSGEAGIGKSRLVAEVKTRVEQEQAHFLQGACFEQDRALPFAPLLDLLRTLLLSESREATLRSLAPVAPELIKILPDLTLWLPEVRPTPVLSPEQERRRLFVALTHFLLGQAEQYPLVLSIEDLHWSDDASLEFLLYLVRYLRSRPLLLLLTYRGEEVYPALHHFLSALDRERAAVECSLTPLTIEEVHAMLRAIFQLKRPVRRDFLEALYGLTEGNPFFVEEVLKSLLAVGDIYFTGRLWDRKPLGELQIPRSVSDAVQQRIGLLSEQAREMLELVAVVGRYVDFSLVQALTGQSEPEVFACIEILIAAQLLVETSAEQVAFRHALTRAAVYQGLLARQRQALHWRVAQMIERLSASSLEAHLAELAYHFYRAQAWTQALAYAQRVGEKAIALYAPRAAIEHFTHALEAARHLPGVNPVPLYQIRGEVSQYLSDFEAAISDFEQVLEGARVAQDRQAEWQGLIDLGHLWTERDYSQAGGFFRQALDLAQALEDPRKYAFSQKHLANWLTNVGEPASAMALLEESLQAFEHQGDLPMVAQTLQVLGVAASIYGERRLSLSCLDRAIALLRTSGEKWVLVVCLALRTSIASPAGTEAIFCMPGSLASCQQDLEEALRVADSIEWRAGQAFAHYMSGWAFASFGALGEALAHARAALEIATEIENRQWTVGSYSSVGDVAIALLDPAQAIVMLQAGREIGRELGAAFYLGNMTAALAQAYLLTRDLARAEATLAQFMPPEQVPRNLQERRLLWTWGELALAQQQPKMALRLAEELIASAPGEAQRAEGQPIPALLKLRGEALFALGQVEEAIHALEAARRGAQEQGVRPLLWQIHRTLGRVYAASKQKQLAHQAFADAREVIGSLAASIAETEQRERFLDAALATLPKEHPLTPRQSAKHAFGGLSERERAIAQLIAQGKSNREIAEVFIISERTVETHLGRMYAKLGFSTRAQLAAWVVEKGLALPSLS
jgi:DNA-binding CsgD family transcriptional regulator